MKAEDRYLVGVESIVGKGENAGNQHFLLFKRCILMCSTFMLNKT